MRFLYPISQTSIAPILAGWLAYLDPHGPAAPIIDTGITNDEYELAILRKDPRQYHGAVKNKVQYIDNLLHDNLYFNLTCLL